jgi:predicted O-linked N-acetylglucosamine transferase (SPINDLY family)
VNPSPIALQQAFELALGHHRAGQLAQAGQLYQEVLRMDPRHPDALHLLGLITFGAGDAPAAEALLRRAVAAAPSEAEFRNNLGVVCQSSGKFRDAASCFQAAVKRQPNYAEAMNNLSAVLSEEGRLTESAQWARRAAMTKPGYAEPLNNLGNTLVKQGLVEEAVEAYRGAVSASPRQWQAWSNLLLGMHYLPDVPSEELFAMHARVGREMIENAATLGAHGNGRDPERRLRIGYVSADLRTHSVCYFALPMLQHHDRSAVEVFCYADTARPDEMTARAKSLADEWRSITGLPDDAVAAMIREDRIDVLVDLSGHTLGNRLPVFARRAAPVQVTYLGYPDTTGLATMDYRLTDSFADPVGEADARTIEKLVRIERCAWSYSPVSSAPEITARKPGPVTFGTFNALAKINSQVLATWAGILRETPGSRLMIKAGAMSEAPARERFTRAMAAHGIEKSRLLLAGHRADPREHLSMYGSIDVALDPFPYNGTTTTCEALWMGVPVVTLAGRAHAGRVGISLLNAVGLSDLVAKDLEHYRHLAAGLAGDPDRLQRLRAELRDRMRGSALMDGAGFSRALETAYRQMWQSWCGASG